MKRTQDERLEGAAFTPRRDKRGQWSYWVTLPFAEGWVAAQRLGAEDVDLAEGMHSPSLSPGGRRGRRHD